MRVTLPKFLPVVGMFVHGIFVLMCCLLAQLMPQPAWALEVKDVRVGFNDQTRLVIETDEKVQAKVFTLPSPPRVVVDLPPVDNMDVRLSDVHLPPQGIVKSVRDGIFNRTTHRLVFDLTTSAKYKKFTIPPRGKRQHRIVIDLTSRSADPVTQQDVASTSFTKRQSQKTPQKADEAEPDEAEPDRPEEDKSKPDKTHKDFVIIIDAGHGGIDPGAVGNGNNYEKDVVLKVARKTAKALNQHSGIKAHLTRDSDTFLRLQERVDIAKDLNADIFVSLHADGHNNKRVRGGSVYVLSESASEREAERLSILANRGVEPITGLKEAGRDKIVKDILIDLAQRDTMNNSSRLARAIINAMDKVTYMRRKDILFAGFKVLKAPDIPSMLVEIAYMSNPNEEKKLKTAAFQKKISKAISDGIVQYVQNLP